MELKTQFTITVRASVKRGDDSLWYPCITETTIGGGEIERVLGVGFEDDSQALQEAEILAQHHGNYLKQLYSNKIGAMRRRLGIKGDGEEEAQP